MDVRSRWFRTLATDDLGREALQVILVILSEIEDGWMARLTPTEIARTLQKSRSNVERAVKELCRKGAIEKVHEGGKLMGYRVRAEYGEWSGRADTVDELVEELLHSTPITRGNRHEE